MALFRIKKKDDKKDEEKKAKDSVVSDTKAAPEDIPSLEKTAQDVVEKKKTTTSNILSLNYKKDVPAVLRHARVTEKATSMSERGVYVFDVSPRATKEDVREAVKALYKVTPLKINMVRVPSKKVSLRGAQNKYGVKSGGKKAYVFVKKGDTIDIV